MFGGSELKRFVVWLRANYWWLYAVALVILLVQSVLLWNLLGESDKELNALSISITVLEILLAIIAVTGFWVFRGAVREAAREEALRIIPSIARRATLEWMDSRSLAGNIGESDAAGRSRDQDLVDALGEEPDDDAPR